jgi:inactivated superfamily I helicase
MKRLPVEARAKGMLVVFPTGPTGKRADILPDVASLESEAIVSTGLDKFANTEPEEVLKAAGTQTVSGLPSHLADRG